MVRGAAEELRLGKALNSTLFIRGKKERILSTMVRTKGMRRGETDVGGAHVNGLFKEEKMAEHVSRCGLKRGEGA